MISTKRKMTVEMVRNSAKEIRVRPGMAEVRDSIFFGVPIKHVYLITSEDKAPRNRTPQPA
jgi:hypothetical protein